MFGLSSHFLSSFSFFFSFLEIVLQFLFKLLVTRKAMVQVSPVDGQIWLVFMSLTSYLYESCALEIIQWIFELLQFFFIQ